LKFTQLLALNLPTITKVKESLGNKKLRTTSLRKEGMIEEYLLIQYKGE